MNTLDLSQKLLRDVMWRLPKEDWGFAEDVAYRLNDLHYRVIMLESLWRVERDSHARNGNVEIVEAINGFLNEPYLRGEA